jgi:hypothetical protein
LRFVRNVLNFAFKDAEGTMRWCWVMAQHIAKKQQRCERCGGQLGTKQKDRQNKLWYKICQDCRRQYYIEKQRGKDVIKLSSLELAEKRQDVLLKIVLANSPITATDIVKLLGDPTNVYYQQLRLHVSTLRCIHEHLTLLTTHQRIEEISGNCKFLQKTYAKPKQTAKNVTDLY